MSNILVDKLPYCSFQLQSIIFEEVTWYILLNKKKHDNLFSQKLFEVCYMYLNSDHFCFINKGIKCRYAHILNKKRNPYKKK